MVKLLSFEKEIRKEYGDIVFLQESLMGVIPTGSLALDVSIGLGGIPAGKFIELYGTESGGKTSTCLTIARTAIRNGMEKVLYIDAENSLDQLFVDSMLEETEDRITVLQPKTAEDAFGMAEKGIQDGIKLIFFDSVAAITPSAEVEKDFDKAQVAQSPRLVAKFLRRNSYDVRTKGVTFVFTNQVRDNIGSLFGGYQTPAGHALKHFLSLRIYMYKGKEIKANKDDEPIGQYTNFIIKKNKVAAPNKQATTNIIYGKGVDFERDVISFAKMLGVVTARGSYLSFEGNTISTEPGTEKAISVLKEDKELLDKIVKMCYNITRISYPEHNYTYLKGEVKHVDDTDIKEDV